MSLLSKFLDYLHSGVPRLEDKPYEIPDPSEDTMREQPDKQEETTVSTTILKIKF